MWARTVHSYPRPCVCPELPSPGQRGTHQPPGPCSNADALPPAPLPRSEAAAPRLSSCFGPPRSGTGWQLCNPDWRAQSRDKALRLLVPHQIGIGYIHLWLTANLALQNKICYLLQQALHREDSGEQRQQLCKAAEKAETSLHAARIWAAISVPGLSHQIDPAVSVRQAYTQKENHLQDGKHYF